MASVRRHLSANWWIQKRVTLRVGVKLQMICFWVNATSLDTQERADGSAYVEHLFEGDGGDQLARLDSRGNLTTRQGAETPIAVGRYIADDVAEFFIRSSSR